MTRVTTDNVALCEARLSIPDWDCSKSLVGALKTQNRLREGFYVSAEVEHSSFEVGCVRN